MNNIAETKENQPKPIREIQIGQDFHPFDPAYTTQNISGLGHKQSKSSIVLNIESNLKIPININTYASRTQKGHAITPFDPALGYQIDSEDLELERRLAKTKRLEDELRQNIDFAKAPLHISVWSDGDLLHELGLNKKHKLSGYQFSQEMSDLLRRLRLLVYFPKSKFEAKPWETSLDLGGIYFREFYPIDSGPLPTSKTYRGSGPQEGFSLFLPSDPEKLAQIRARFVMVEEQPQE